MNRRAYEVFGVPVDGGDLTVGAWGEPGAAVVVAIHGITANHMCFAPLAAALPELRVIGPDLRGRGRSNRLPGPCGMARHAADVAAAIESVGSPVLVVGHSMGGFVAAELVRTRPDLVAGLLLLDGGLPLEVPAGIDRDTALALTLGPALQRLRMTFPTRETYREFWRQHPALRDDWTSYVEAYVDYDLTGDEPELRSSVSAEAVATDSADLFDRPPGDAVLGSYAGPARMLVVDKGLQGTPPGLYSTQLRTSWQERLPDLPIETVPDLNHYTLVLSPGGAARVAEAVRAL